MVFLIYDPGDGTLSGETTSPPARRAGRALACVWPADQPVVAAKQVA
jgi:hypothetical protein